MPSANDTQRISGLVRSNMLIAFGRVGAHNPGPKAMSMLDLTNPEIRWVSLAEGMGVPAWRVTTVEEFVTALQASLTSEGPTLIEVML